MSISWPITIDWKYFENFFLGRWIVWRKTKINSTLRFYKTPRLSCTTSYTRFKCDSTIFILTKSSIISVIPFLLPFSPLLPRFKEDVTCFKELLIFDFLIKKKNVSNNLLSCYSNIHWKYIHFIWIISPKIDVFRTVTTVENNLKYMANRDLDTTHWLILPINCQI